MNTDMAAKLRRSLVLHEEYKKFPYVDTVGKITIGIGYNLTDRGIDDQWINDQYNRDVAYFYAQLSKDFDWFLSLNEDRQIVLVDMCFMGYQRFLEFKGMLDALAKGDFKQAAVEMLDSKWATQVKGRATSLAHGMLTGVYIV